ncbi:response regulator, partial [Candidatus Parcubacteria bacterium]|nr:response regulator [Candidatus Parcubacteria bacterium]
QPLLGRIKDLFVFVGVVFFIAAIVPSIGYTVSYLSYFLVNTGLPSISWINWWIGELFGLMVFGPFFMRWFAYPRVSYRNQNAWIEAGITMGVVCFMGWVLFWTPYSSVVGISLIFLLLIPFFWIALRVGPRFMTLTLVVLALIALIGTPLGIHPASTSATSIGSRLLSVELFMLFLTMVFLTLTAASEERKDTTLTLERHVDELEDALSRIRREDQAKTDFLATLAHELRNPLSPIISSLDLIDTNIAKGRILPENEPHIKNIRTHVQMVTHLLDDLLDISRITRKKFKLNKSPINLNATLLQATQTVSSLYKERNHTLNLSLPKDQIWMEADPLRLQQIFVNLLYNAGKYTNPGGTISLSAQVKNEKLEVVVKDNGIGIGPEMLRKIFEPFVQVPTDARIGTGLGIGLSLTKRLVELHGGYVRAQSEGLGKGSTFIVTLPLPRAAQLPIPLVVPTPTPSYKARPQSILLVDDNEPAAQTLSSLLKAHGYSVETAYSGLQALEASSNHPDIIILDIGLPDMDGYKVAEELKKKELSSVLIALTGYGQSEDKRKAHEAGFAYHLTKPVGIAEIQAVLNKIHV